MDSGGGGRAEGFGLEVGVCVGVAGGGGDAHCLGGGLDGLFDGRANSWSRIDEDRAGGKRDENDGRGKLTMVSSDVSSKCLRVLWLMVRRAVVVKVEGVDELQARVEDAESSNTSAVLALTFSSELPPVVGNLTLTPPPILNFLTMERLMQQCEDSLFVRTGGFGGGGMPRMQLDHR